MRTIFKVCEDWLQCCFCFMLLVFFFFWPRERWDLSSPTRAPTSATLEGKVLTTRPPESPFYPSFLTMILSSCLWPSGIWHVSFSVSVIQNSCLCFFVSEQRKKKKTKKKKTTELFLMRPKRMTSVWVICISVTSVYHQFTFSTVTPGLWSSISVFSEVSQGPGNSSLCLSLRASRAPEGCHSLPAHLHQGAMRWLSLGPVSGSSPFGAVFPQIC